MPNQYLVQLRDELVEKANVLQDEADSVLAERDEVLEALKELNAVIEGED